MIKAIKAFIIIFLLATSVFSLFPTDCCSQTPTISTPLMSLAVDKEGNPDKVAVVMQIFLLMTVLTLAPAILIMVTSFTRVAIVLSVLRQALGTNQMPPNQIILGLALFLTFFIMTPVWDKINEQALQPFLQEEISQKVALEKAIEPLRKFMFKQTREKDLALFLEISKTKRPNITSM